MEDFFYDMPERESDEYTGMQEIEQKDFTAINNIIKEARELMEFNKQKQKEEDQRLYNMALRIAVPKIAFSLETEVLQIAKEEFRSTFDIKYGKKNYDADALSSCIKINVDHNLVPHIDYDSYNFVTKINKNKEQESFNQNVKHHHIYDDSDFESLETLELADSFGISLDDENELENMIEEESLELDYDSNSDRVNEEDKRFMVNKTKGINEIGEVFKEAKMKAENRVMEILAPSSTFFNYLCSIFKDELNRQYRNKKR